MKFLRLGIAGLRGEIGSGLTPELAIRFASAFGTWLEGGKIIVGRDTRYSSDMLYNSVVSSLLSCGCQVCDANICPAPFLHFLVPHLEADGAMLIGAGHHPANWNALVPLGRDGAYLNAIESQELLDLYHAGRFARRSPDRLGSLSNIPGGADDAYINSIRNIVNPDAVADAQITAVADFCNGSGSVIADKFSRALGIRLIPINNLLSGVLPHDPEPRPRSSFQARSIVAPLNAHGGFVFNSDMSRLAVVTDSGETLSEELTFPLAANHLLSKLPPKQTVITNTCTTRTLDSVAASHDARVVKTKVGQAYIIDAMREHHAILGGDGSGSVAVAGHVNGYDGFAAMALIAEAIAVNNIPLSGLAGQLPRFNLVKKTIPCHAANAYSLLRNIKQHCRGAKVSDDDGIRFDWKDGWIHLRNSATEPLIRMIVEWNSHAEAEDRALEMRGIIDRMVYHE